jgi:CRP-like cAMP-binding protein
VLEEFVARGIAKVHCAAGKTLTSQAHEDRTLFVLAAGSALLHAGDDIAIALEPGDYFGDGLAGRHQPISSVVAVSDIEVLVISPQDVAWLEQASCRDRHPSRTDWRTTLPSSARPGLRWGHRRLALAR